MGINDKMQDYQLQHLSPSRPRTPTSRVKFPDWRLEDATPEEILANSDIWRASVENHLVPSACLSEDHQCVSPCPKSFWLATRKQEAFWRPGLALNSTDLVIPSAAGVKWMSLTCRTQDSKKLEERLRNKMEASETPLRPFQPHLCPIIASKGAQHRILGVICGHGNAKEDEVSIITADWCAEHGSPRDNR
ncbi:hypothetical protein GH733_005560 [Mirounga leonina]|nr:hypothetical protein GH733_005560 [Mirounga leonina]